MRRFPLPISMTVLCSLLLLACHGSSDLDRVGALKLVRAYDQKNAVVLNKVVSIPIWSAILTADTRFVIGGAATTQQAKDQLELQQAQIEFYDGLIAKGWIEKESCNLDPKNFICYEPRSAPARWKPFIETGNRRNMFIDVAGLKETTITGVAMNGDKTAAEAEVEYDVEPTDAYKTFMDLVKEVSNRHPTITDRIQNAVYSGTMPPVVTKKDQQRYHFQKFDDGWRIITF